MPRIAVWTCRHSTLHSASYYMSAYSLPSTNSFGIVYVVRVSWPGEYPRECSGQVEHSRSDKSESKLIACHCQQLLAVE
jgi:hypothetical protein